ncbi:MAG: lytic transglycosylase domain-containing protein, partial [Burkholderiaceae bacterium]
MQIKPNTTILTPLLTTLLSVALATVYLGSAAAQNGTSNGSSNGSNPRTDSVLLEMNQAFKKGDKARLTALLPQVSGHALEPWGAYWELKARLDEASGAEVQNFLTRYAGTYQEDRLRNDWLLLLGQRRDWGAFAAEYPKYRMKDDKEVRCYALLVDHLQGGQVAATLTGTTPAERAAEVRKHWWAQRDADDGCNLAADRLIKDPNSANTGMVAQDAYRKARLAMEVNRPRAARNALQIVSLDTANALAEIQADPSRFLRKRATALGTERKEAEVLALIRLALSDADGAATLLDAKWSVQLTAEQRNWAWGAIGKQAAQNLNSQAVSYFSNVGKDTDLNDDMLGWKVRAALRAGATPQWPMVVSAVNAMSDEARKEPTWTYWKARALKVMAQARFAKNSVRAEAPSLQTELQEANALFESIASVRGFYEQLALEELGRKITVPERPLPLTPQEKEAVRQNPGLKRALAAIAIGLRPEGVREWNYSTNLHTTNGSSNGTSTTAQTGAVLAGMSDRELLAAAQLACEREVWDRCINTSERTKTVVDLEQRFPMPHQREVVKRSAE